MFKKLLLGLLAHASLTLAVPFPHDTTPQEGVQATKLQARFGDPENCPGYAATNVVKTDSSLTADLTLAGNACNVYSEDIKDLKLEVEYQSDKRLHIKIYDTERSAFQVQEQVLPRPPNNKVSVADAALQFDIVEKPFSFKVTRKANQEVIFDSTAGKLVFEKQYVRWRTRLPEEPNVYGFGEHSDRFRFAKTYRRVLWNSESPNIPTNANLYGTHPVYFDHRGDKGTHGVFLLNSNGMEIFTDQDPKGQQYLEYNTNGGIIDLYIMDGPKPADVSRQYAEVVGLPAMFPYWSLGFHQCRFGYWDANMVAEVVGNYSTAGIPLEVMWTDIDYMDARQDFTTDPERFPIPKMRELVSTLHSRDQRYIMILDPGIHAVGNYAPYERGIKEDVFLKGADGTDILGVQWPGASVWPDWFHPNTAKWWSNEIAIAFSKDTGIDLDGLWVDMNEASNFCPDQTCNPRYKEATEELPPKPEHAPRPNTGRPIPGFPASFQPSSKKQSLEARETIPERSTGPVTGQMKGYPDRDLFDPNYRINNHRGDLTDYTIYTNTSNFDGTFQYDTHNFYGHMMAHTTYDAMLTRRPGLRPFVLTRSTFAGSGRKVSHWFGDNFSNWDHYRTSIRQMLEFVAIHQMPLVGSDVCGFNGDTNEELCARWAMLGAFQPFYRNHAELSTIQQEFYQWPLVATAAKKAIKARYQLLDYIYTAMHNQHKDGTPTVNPLFFIYPEDSNTFGIQDQWFYGDALLISPVTAEHSKEATYYLPDDIFYDFWTSKPVNGQGKNVTQTNVDFTDIPIHIRGGTVIPMRVNSAMTTKALRQEGIHLLIAPGRDGKAKGKLYMDEGELIDQPGASEVEFSFEDGHLSVTGSFAFQPASGESVSVTQITVLGQDTPTKKGSHNREKRTVTVAGPWQLNGAFKLQL